MNIAPPKRLFRLGIDIDGVLADFVSNMVVLLEHVGAPKFETGPDFPPRWEWFQISGATTEQVDHAWEIIKQDYTFWVRLPPYLTAYEDLRTLKKVIDNGHEVYFITTRPGNRAMFQSQAWLARMGVIFPSVLIADNPTAKGKLAEGLKLDAFIDDRPENLLALPGTVMPFLMKRPYNKEWREQFPALSWVVESVDEMIGVLDKSGAVKEAA